MTEDTKKFIEKNLDRLLHLGDFLNRKEYHASTNEINEFYALKNQTLEELEKSATFQKLYASADGDRTVLIHECEKLRLDIENLKKVQEQLTKENKYLKEDAEITNVIDWGDNGQRECPTHKISYHLYCKLCKNELKSLKLIAKQRELLINKLKKRIPELETGEEYGTCSNLIIKELQELEKCLV